MAPGCPRTGIGVAEPPASVNLRGRCAVLSHCSGRVLLVPDAGDTAERDSRPCIRAQQGCRFLVHVQVIDQRCTTCYCCYCAALRVTVVTVLILPCPRRRLGAQSCPNPACANRGNIASMRAARMLQPQQSAQSVRRPARLPCTFFPNNGGWGQCFQVLTQISLLYNSPAAAYAALASPRCSTHMKGQRLAPKTGGPALLSAANTLLGTCLPTPRQPAHPDRCMLKHRTLSYTVHMPTAPTACPRQRARPGPVSVRIQPSKQPIRETSTRCNPAWPVAASPAQDKHTGCTHTPCCGIRAALGHARALPRLLCGRASAAAAAPAGARPAAPAAPGVQPPPSARSPPRPYWRSHQTLRGAVGEVQVALGRIVGVRRLRAVAGRERRGLPRGALRARARPRTARARACAAARRCTCGARGRAA
jgi:hypothetical protein